MLQHIYTMIYHEITCVNIYKADVTRLWLYLKFSTYDFYQILEQMFILPIYNFNFFSKYLIYIFIF